VCSRSMFSTNPQQVAERFALAAMLPELPMPYRVAPQMRRPIIVATTLKRLDFRRWGLVPAWAMDERAGYETRAAAVLPLLQPTPPKRWPPVRYPAR
jgi:putative SOS response-associated peptidase YedK